MRKLPILPCYPCPHKGACCQYGTSVLGDEEKAIRAIYGDEALVWDDEDKEFRTSVVNGRCGLCGWFGERILRCVRLT